MPRRLLIFAAVLAVASAALGQSANDRQTGDALFQQNQLAVDLQGLEIKAARLGQPLAVARADAEIADAVWSLDPAWAKKLLRKGYELTLPEEEERIKLRRQTAGEIGARPTDADLARREIRNRIFEIAGRDKNFANELLQMGAKELGKFEEYYSYTNLAAQLIADGETKTASDYLLKAVETDPTQMSAGFFILEIAGRDRKAADNLILQYISRLRAFPLSQVNYSALRTYTILTGLVFPDKSLPLIAMFKGSDTKYQQITPASPATVKAYVYYVIESMGGLEQREPGSAKELRRFLLGTWLPLKQYAPELLASFSELEAVSRRPGESAGLPIVGEDASKTSYEQRVKNAVNSRQPDDLDVAIGFALSRGDFEAAHRMIDLLPDGRQKIQYLEDINTREAISLAAKGDVLAARKLAEELNKAVSILQVYPILIDKCALGKDATCAGTLVYQAIKQLKRADDEAHVPASLGKLAKAVLPVDEALALEVLEELVQALNRGRRDTGLGRIGFDAEVFRKLAAKNELRARQAAETLKDPLQELVAEAAILQLKTEQLSHPTRSLPHTAR